MSKNEVITKLELKDESVSESQLIKWMNEYSEDMEVSKLIAAHPNCGIDLIAFLHHLVPEDVEKNPSLPEHKENSEWKEKTDRWRPRRAEYSLGEWFYRLRIAGAHEMDSEGEPLEIEMAYWLEHGDYKDKKYILEYYELELGHLVELSKDSSPHMRKLLASSGDINDDGKPADLKKEVALILVKDRTKSVRLALAKNSLCPPDVLETLSIDKDLSVREAALKNKNCPEEIVRSAKIQAESEKLVSNDDFKTASHQEIIKLLADKHTSSAVLAKMSLSEDAYVRAGVALHRNTNEKTLCELVNDKDSTVIQCLAYNESSPGSVLEKIYEKGKKYHLELASNPSLSESLQIKLANSKERKIHEILANTTDLYTVWEAIYKLRIKCLEGSSKSDSIVENLKILLNFNSTDKELYSLQRSVDSRELFVSKLVSMHPNCPDKLKKYYAFYFFDYYAKNPSVALQLLENPSGYEKEKYAEWKVDYWLEEGSAPGHVVKHLLESVDLVRKRKAIENYSATTKSVQALIYEEDIHLYKRLLKTKHVTPYMYEILARSTKPSIREIVAKSSKVPIHLLTLLSEDKVNSVKVAATQNKRFPLEKKKSEPEIFRNRGQKKDRIKMAEQASDNAILFDLAQDKVKGVREAVAYNKHCSVEILSMLATDEEPDVRRYVAYHDAANSEILSALCRDVDDEVRLRALRYHYYLLRDSGSINEDIDKSLFDNFYNDKSDKIKKFVAEKTASEDTQRNLFLLSNDSISNSLAKNKNLVSSIARGLLELNSRIVTKSLIESTSDPDVFIESIDHESVLGGNYLDLWRNEGMFENESVRKRIMTCRNEEARACLAYSCKDSSMLDKLVIDPSVAVREAVSSNTKLSRKQVGMLLANPSSRIISSLSCTKIKPFLNKLIELRNDNVTTTLIEFDYIRKENLELVLQKPSYRVLVKLLQYNAIAMKKLVGDYLRSDDENLRSACADFCYLTVDQANILLENPTSEIIKKLGYQHYALLMERKKDLLKICDIDVAASLLNTVDPAPSDADLILDRPELSIAFNKSWDARKYLKKHKEFLLSSDNPKVQELASEL